MKRFLCLFFGHKLEPKYIQRGEMLSESMPWQVCLRCKMLGDILTHQGEDE